MSHSACVVIFGCALLAKNCNAMLVRCSAKDLSGHAPPVDAGRCGCKLRGAQPVREVNALEACATHAMQRTAKGHVVGFHFQRAVDGGAARCAHMWCKPCNDNSQRLVPLRPSPQQVGEMPWEVFADRQLCPEGIALIFTDALPSGVGVNSSVDVEYARTFGTHRLRKDQRVRRFLTQCDFRNAPLQRVVASVCFGGHAAADVEEYCDEWSKFASPRCRVFLGTPYDTSKADFFKANACISNNLFYCPTGVPIAIRALIKGGSRATALWAAAIEGLLPSIVATRRALTALLKDGQGREGRNFALERFSQEWLHDEANRLNCPKTAQQYMMFSAISEMDDAWPMLGLPLELCPTCCATAAGRIRVVFLRNPFARLVSYFLEDWLLLKRHLAPDLPFSVWIEEILSDTPNLSLIDSRDQLDVAPAFNRQQESDEVVFLLEEPDASLARVENALCASEIQHCTPLPEFPEQYSSIDRGAEVTWSSTAIDLVRLRYKFDLAIEAANTVGGVRAPQVVESQQR